MNRREILASLVGIASSVGAAGAVASAVDKPAPLLFTLTFPEDYCDPTDEDVARIQAKWKALFNGAPPAPIVVLPARVKLEARRDPR